MLPSFACPEMLLALCGSNRKEAEVLTEIFRSISRTDLSNSPAMTCFLSFGRRANRSHTTPISGPVLGGLDKGGERTISINDTLDGHVVAPINQVIPTGQRRILAPQMLFQGLEEIDILSADERNQNAQCTQQTRPHHDISTTGHQLCLLYTCGDILREEMRH